MTNDQRPIESSPAGTAAPARRWLPTFQQFRLGVLMTAIVLAISGMTQNDARLIKGALVVAGVGVAMRIYGRYRQRQGEG